MVNRPKGLRGGFTMTELAVVITIMIILAAILFPVFSRYQKQARTVQGLNNLGQIGKGLTTYAVDHNNTYPPGYHDRTKTGTSIPSPWNRIIETSWAVLLNSDMAGTPNDTNLGGWQAEDMLPIFQDPNATFPDRGYLHYSSHPVLMPDTENAFVENDWPIYKLSRLKRPSEMAMVMDGAQRPTAASGPFTSFATAKDIDDGSLVLDGPKYTAGEEYFTPESQSDLNTPIDPGDNKDVDDTGDIRWRQGSDSDNPATWKANFVFPDGHAATMLAPDIKKRNIRVDK